jgi:SPP1 family predicted phage head-tail adaptor
MNKYGEVTLITQSKATDTIGQQTETAASTKTIECTVGSITRGEWITARQGGYEADAMLSVFSASYNGESRAEYNGKTYDIYRTYQDGDHTELYLGTRVGDLQ